ncbi:uncharacterized protein LOC124167633 [Ischnura elegans]|uniref:uncharacterized protein LOC124167633 n=1 Tax=Ischnura elegans TaxID=197161 RepID=UPI001ED88FAA|nr:uncharacterized protein LOC124167633 [Ischnura elegans]
MCLGKVRSRVFDRRSPTTGTFEPSFSSVPSGPPQPPSSGVHREASRPTSSPLLLRIFVFLAFTSVTSCSGTAGTSTAAADATQPSSWYPSNPPTPALMQSDQPAEAVAVTTCGGVARGRRGVLQTPGFPGPFPVPLRCRWVIDASNYPGSDIVAYLTQVFVTSGLRFESFAYLDADGSEGNGFGGWPGIMGSGGSPIGRQLILSSESRPPALEEVGWIRSESPFLVATLNLDRLEGDLLNP